MNERIIVSLTSYKGRIAEVGKVIFSILQNTLQPYKIVLNLSTDEFPNKEKELPEDLLVLTSTSKFEIFWVKENTKQFKKLIPTLERFPNDIVISIDDDVIYPDCFIETLYKDFCEIGKVNPITCGYWRDRWAYNGEYSHHGSYTLITKDMFGDKFEQMKKLIKEHLWKELWFDDPLYTYFVQAAGHHYIRSRFDGNMIKKTYGMKNSGVSNAHYRERMKEHKFLKELLFK